MKKTLIALFICVMSSVILTACNSNDAAASKTGNKDNVFVTESNEDVEAIRKTALDYIEGWYAGDAERMKRALHPDLVKRRINGEKIHNIGYDIMLRNTKKGGGKEIPKDSYEIEVKVLDVNNNIATVMTKSQFIDYLHLAKINNRWVIVNVLWG